MASEIVTDIKLRLTRSKKSFTISDLKLTATDQQLIDLAEAVNSLQDSGMDKVTKTVEARLIYA